MSEERSKILDKAKKLKELADRGVDGEMANAKDMLEKYMKKHNITMKEIESHDYSSSSVFSNMTEQEFLQEILIDLAAFGIGLFITSLFGKGMSAAFKEKSFNEFNKKYGDELKKRQNRK